MVKKKGYRHDKMISVVIPAHNEEGNIEKTVVEFNKILKKNKIEHELLVVNDNSTDKTEHILKKLSRKIKEMRYINNEPPNGFGYAIIKGLQNFNGDYVTIAMADLSDDPDDLVKYYNKILKGYDCVFGSRFIKGGRVIDYPRFKLVLNRIVNNLIRVLFWIRYNDITNPFKLYKRECIKKSEPFVSKHFNLEVEIPLKVIIKGYSYAVIPNTWRNRDEGVTKFKIKEMGSKYFYTLYLCLYEKFFKKNK